jgi:UDP-N-acetylglucosamine 2-epimerase (non-hydrolysing)
MSAVTEISEQIPVLFPVHPRTRSRISSLKLNQSNRQLILTEPMGYLDFLALQMKAALLLTDSGGIQEETTYLGIPCLTARPNTERPVTITNGTNQLVESRATALLKAIRQTLNNDHGQKNLQRPELWDVGTAERISRLFMTIS